MTPIQLHILAHCNNKRWDAGRSVDENISLFNLDCVTGMIETGEATWDDLKAVGGDELSAAVACNMENE